MAAVISISILFGLLSVNANAKIRLYFDAQPLAQAITDLARLANVDIYFDESAVKGQSAPAVIGEVELDEALTRLLADAPLRAVCIKKKAMCVISSTEARRVPSTYSALSSVGSKFSAVRVAYPGAELPIENSSSEGPLSSIATQGENISGLEEVLVTAQRREESVLDVPISIVALSANELLERHVTSIDDLALAVPDLAIESTGLDRRIEIRGISNFGGNGTPNVGIYLDEADVTGGNEFQPDIGVFDLERVEVLRGPQGTLYGGGSTGGTVRFITKNPVLDRVTFDSDITASFTQGGGAPSQRILEVVNVPVIDNVLGLRIAGSFDHQGGWINQPAANQININGQDRIDLRMKGLWQPVQPLTVLATATIHRNDGGVGVGEDASGNYTQVLGQTTTPRLKDDYDIDNLTVTYDFAAAQLLSSTTYIHQNESYWNYGYSLQEFDPPPGPQLQVYDNAISKTHSLIEETRLSSRGNEAWQWTFGGYYKYLKNENSGFPAIYEGFAGPLAAAPLIYLSQGGGDRNAAVFGDTSYKFAERVTLGVGVRYFKDIPLVLYSSCCSGTDPFNPSATAGSHSLAPRFYTDFKASDQISVYASAAKGFRPGGANLFGQPSFGPENVWSYELGTKTSFLDRRLSANAAVFYSLYKDYQIQGLITEPLVANVTSNGGDAWIKGVEWDLTWRFLDQWTASFNGAMLDTRFYRIDVTDDAYNVGDGLDFIPKHTFTAALQRDYELNGKKGFVRLDYSQQGRETFRNRSYGPWFFSESDTINMLNLNSTLQWNDNITWSLFARNLLNDRGLTSPGGENTETNIITRSRPRTYGVEVNVKFE
jgi:outer membrane receptor protein involved in Fe transport